MSRYIHSVFYDEISKLSGFETFCYQNCQRILLMAKDIGNSELYINATLSLRYDKIKNKPMLGDSIRSLLPSFEQSVTRIYYNYDVNPEYVFKENIQYMIEHNEPIIVGVDTYYLHYALNYNKNHAIHTLVLCGFDLSKNCVYVIDWYPDWYYKGTVNIEEFLKARASKNPYDGTIFSGSEILNNWATIDNVKKSSPKKLFLELFDVINSEYYKNSCDNILYGIEAIYALKNYLFESEKTETYKEIYVIVINVCKRYKLFKQYIECFGMLDTDVSIFACLECLANVINDWDIISMLVMKGSMCINDKLKSRLDEKMNKLINDEYKLKRSIFELKESIQDI